MRAGRHEVGRGQRRGHQARVKRGRQGRKMIVQGKVVSGDDDSSQKMRQRWRWPGAGILPHRITACFAACFSGTESMAQPAWKDCKKRNKKFHVALQYRNALTVCAR